MLEKVAGRLLEKQTTMPEIREAFVGKVEQVAHALFRNDIDAFLPEFCRMDNEFQKAYGEICGYETLVAALVSSINDVIGRNFWMFFDNVDLEAPNFQPVFARSGFAVYNRVCQAGDRYGWTTQLSVVITARPETVKRWSGYFDGFQDYYYPTPNLLGIATQRISDAIDKVTNSYKEKNKFGVNFYISDDFVQLDNVEEFGKFLKGAIGKGISPYTWPWNSLGGVSEWHLALCGSNVRRFIKAWVHILVSDSFRYFWMGGLRHKRSNISPHAYLRMLIKGPYNEHGGNKRINCSGYDADSPLIFNVYDYPNKNVSHDAYINNYFVFVRLLQFINGADKAGVEVQEIRSKFAFFFDARVVTDALKWLVWAGIVDELSFGHRNTYGETHKNIDLKPNARIARNNTSFLYANELIIDYGYISSMAMVSNHLENQVSESLRGTDEVRVVQTAKAALAFLDSLLFILIKNFSSYKKSGRLDAFRDIFIMPDASVRPWRGAVENSIRAIGNLRDHNETLGFLEISQDLEQINLEFRNLLDEGREKIKGWIG